MRGSEVFPGLHVLQKGVVGNVLLRGRVVDKGGDCAPGLFALQEVETGHVLLQGFHTKAVAVLAVESSLLFDRCGCVLPLFPVLRGTQAAPL